jgi:mannose-6-phosphate isomerase-like protein (cupin superfamily)
MTEVSIVGPQDGEEVVPAPSRVRIIEDGSTTDHRLAVAVLTLEPHTNGPPPHWHQKHDEGFYVLSGTPRCTAGDREYGAPTGTFVMVPTGAEHTFANPGDETAVILNTFTPDLYVQYFRDLREVIDSGRMTKEAGIEVMARYASYPAGQPAPPPEAQSAMNAEQTTITQGRFFADDLSVTISDQGNGRPVLLLHGGGGPLTMAGLPAAVKRVQRPRPDAPRLCRRSPPRLASRAPPHQRHRAHQRRWDRRPRRPAR